MKRIFPCLLAVMAITMVFSPNAAAERLTASGVSSGDRFGASVSMAGTRAFVGAPMDDAIGTDAGGVQVFTRQTTATTSTWKFASSLIPYSPGNHAHFGASVSAHGTSVAVGAPGADGVGAVFLFQENATWTQQAKLTANDGAAGDEFGHSVALCGDVLLVGAPRRSSGTGAVYIFERGNAVWTQTAKLTPTATGTSFGWSVALEGNVAVIGAIHDQDNGASAGAAHVFVNTNGVWAPAFKMKPYDGLAGAFFGFSVDIDNGVIAVGSPARDYNGLVNCGSVHVFEPSGSNQWIEIHQLTGGAKANDHFGRSVALTSSWLAAGADGSDNPDNGGSVYLYALDGQHWVLRDTLTQDDGAGENDRLGWPLAMTQEGNYYWLLAGASSSSSERENGGAAYGFTNYVNNAPQHSRATLALDTPESAHAARCLGPLPGGAGRFGRRIRHRPHRARIGPPVLEEQFPSATAPLRHRPRLRSLQGLEFPRQPGQESGRLWVMRHFRRRGPHGKLDEPPGYFHGWRRRFVRAISHLHQRYFQLQGELVLGCIQIHQR